MRYFQSSSRVAPTTYMMLACLFIPSSQASGGDYLLAGSGAPISGSFSDQARFFKSSGLASVSYGPQSFSGGSVSCTGPYAQVDIVLASEVQLVYSSNIGAGLIVNGADFSGNGAITTSGTITFAAGSALETNGRVAAVWGIGGVPGENVNNPIVVDDAEELAEPLYREWRWGPYMLPHWVESKTPFLGGTAYYGCEYYKDEHIVTDGGSPSTSSSSPILAEGDAPPEGNYAIGYGFVSAGDGPKFTKLVLPEALPGGDNTFELFSGPYSYGIIAVGSEFDFTGIAADGVSDFVLMGVDPAEQLSSTLPFPMTVGLQFATEGLVDLHAATLSQVPEPSGMALLALGAATAVVLRLRRRNSD